MITAIELHDSEVTYVDEAGAFILLRAYIHRASGNPGRDNGEGGIQRIRLAFSNMKVGGEIGDLPTYIYDGSLSILGSIQENILPFPAEYADGVTLKIMLAEDARVLIIKGSYLAITAESDFEFVEMFPLK